MLIRSYKARGKIILQQRDNYLLMASKGALWLHTIPKSGTTFFLVFFTNYLNNLLSADNGFVNLRDVNDRFFLHSLDNQIKRQNLLEFYEKRTNLVEEYGYSDLVCTHSIINGSAWKKSIFLYRNPLDWLVSYYFWRYVNRKKLANYRFILRSPKLLLKKDPSQILELELPFWIENYKSFQDRQSERPLDTLGMSFESLMSDKTKGLEKILSFLSIPVNHEILAKCLAITEKEKDYKDKEGNLIGRNMTTGFVRGGKPGEWKTYFGEKEIDKARNIFSNHGLDLDNFIQQ